MKKTAIISAAAVIVTTMTAPLASSSTAVVHENQTTKFIEDSRGANKDKFDGNTFTSTFGETVKDENGFSKDISIRVPVQEPLQTPVWKPMGSSDMDSVCHALAPDFFH
ncbi:hypothetical protein OS128_12575 [Corynebacterium sp. P5848]|uniref:hypothetical protein n=1 Tax=Corynebacterium marambiense TaxID=2765364 RepID=UPI002260EFBE|nr:hypothetical protein [Corynebacterium marambiense]MCX7543739.1 hypothetical protein [Corynebacterium marambiense]